MSHFSHARRHLKASHEVKVRDLQAGEILVVGHGYDTADCASVLRVRHDVSQHDFRAAILKGLEHDDWQAYEGLFDVVETSFLHFFDMSRTSKHVSFS